VTVAVLERPAAQPPTVTLPPLSAVQAERARRSLRRFVELAWPIVEPETEFVSNWHIDLLCAKLEAVSRGDIQRLLVNIPPGTSKSLIVSVFWPAWEWASNPAMRYLTASYSDELTIRDNLRVRDIVESEWYQRHFGAVQFRPDQNRKTRFDTTATGWRIATSVGGRATGEHPDRVIIDDPHNPKQALSDVQRKEALVWFDRTISSRGVSRGARIVVIMQRLHESDLSGHLLARGGWHHVCWPMRYDLKTSTADDPRSEPGDLLWPRLFDDRKVRQLEIDLGPYGAAGQLQQKPAPEGGGLFKRGWFPIVDASRVPAHARRCRGWDTAATEDDGDYTCGVKMAEADGIFFIEDVVREQVGPDGVDRLIENTAKLDGPDCKQREEKEGGASGKIVIAHRLKRMAGYDYAGATVTSDKVSRAGGFRAQAEGGNVCLVRGAWNQAYLDELAIFPNGDHDDQVDGSSCSFNELTLGPGAVRRERIKGV
jgi:predicted phage terminase large subunit-like protein